MRIKKYRKKPVIIEALQWQGHNVDEILSFTNGKGYFRENMLYIKTLEGDHRSIVSDFIIKGVAGEFYPCKEDIFKKTYEEVHA